MSARLLLLLLLQRPAPPYSYCCFSRLPSHPNDPRPATPDPSHPPPSFSQLTLFGLTWPDTKPKKKWSKKATASTAARDGGPAPHHPKTPKSPSNSVSSDERGGESTTKMAGLSGEGGGGKGGGKAGSGGWWTVRLTWGRRKRLKAAAREQASVAEAEAVGGGGTGDGASESAGEEGSREDGESGSRGSSHSGGRRKRGWRKAGAFAALRRRLPSLERDTGSAKASGGGDGERSSQKVRVRRIVLVCRAVWCRVGARALGFGFKELWEACVLWWRLIYRCSPFLLIAVDVLTRRSDTFDTPLLALPSARGGLLLTPAR